MPVPMTAQNSPNDNCVVWAICKSFLFYFLFFLIN
jgi:hypothetical protein